MRLASGSLAARRSNQITSVGGQNYTYDADGNLLSTGTGLGTNTYTWNSYGGMTSDTPTGSPSSAVTILYDPLGRPAYWYTGSTCSGTSCTTAVYGPDGSKLALMNGQTLSRARIVAPGGGIDLYGPAVTLVRYWHSDWQGSMRLVTNPTRTFYSSVAYAPYGETYAASPNSFIPDFGGLLGDTSSEIDDATFRRYSPAQSRWLSPDPAGVAAIDPGNPQSLNRYAYVMNNPMSRTDPRGLGSNCGNAEFPIPSGQNPATYCYNHMPLGWGIGAGLSRSSSQTIAGNDIFDAIAGAPGTYLTVDPYGNLGFGFSPQLWSVSMNLEDALTGGSSPLTSTTGVTLQAGTPSLGVIVYNYATYSEISGAVPDELAALGSMAQFAASNSESLAFLLIEENLVGPAAAAQSNSVLFQQFEALRAQLVSAGEEVALGLNLAAVLTLLFPPPPVLTMPTMPSLPTMPLPPPPP